MKWVGNSFLLPLFMAVEPWERNWKSRATGRRQRNSFLGNVLFIDFPFLGLFRDNYVLDDEVYSRRFKARCLQWKFQPWNVHEKIPKKYFCLQSKDFWVFYDSIWKWASQSDAHFRWCRKNILKQIKYLKLAIFCIRCFKTVNVGVNLHLRPLSTRS